MNFNGGSGFIGTGTIVGPITIDGDLKVTGDLEVDGDIKGDVVSGTIGSFDDISVGDEVSTFLVTTNQLEGKTMSIDDMPVVVPTLASQTLSTGGGSLVIEWPTYNNSESHPSPPTALIPIMSNTAQEFNETGNYTISITSRIQTTGGWAGTLQLVVQRNGLGALVPVPSQTVTGDGTYTLYASFTRYFITGDYFEARIDLSTAALADVGIISLFSAVRVS